MVVAGEVETAPTPLLTDGEKAKGYVLACQSKITGDVSVQIPEGALARKLKIAGMGQSVTDRRKGLVTDIDPMHQEQGYRLCRLHHPAGARGHGFFHGGPHDHHRRVRPVSSQVGAI